MKTVDIITSEMHMIHGANRVTEKLIYGQEWFKENGFFLRYVISQDGIIDCAKYDKSMLGSHLDSSSFQQKRRLIDAAKQLPVYKSYPVQKIILNKLIQSNEKAVAFYESIATKPDLIIYQDPFTAYIALKDGRISCPSILISHAADDPLEHLLMNRPAIKGTREEKHIRELYEYVFRHVSKVVTICRSSQMYMLETYGLDCPCIINGIEDVNQMTVEKLSAQDGKIHIIILASVQHRKGQDIAIKALSELSIAEQQQIILHVVGGGQGTADIIELAQRLNLSQSIILHGPVCDVQNVLASMDIFLLPSRADTVPIAIIEAMRTGLPIFATNVGEIPQMLSGCGELIQPTIQSVLQTYRSILGGQYNLTEMGVNARKKFLEEYNLPSMINKYCDVLKSI